jgi:hypothetical protein
MSADQQRQTRSSNSVAGGVGAAPKARPALDPRTPVLSQPFKGLIETGVLAEIGVRFTPMGTEVYAKASTALIAVPNSGLNAQDKYPVGRLLKIAEEANLVGRPGKKNKSGASGVQAKPARSLCNADLDGSLSPAALQQRISEIARACGGGPLVGRVRSAGKFTGTATTSYRQWWDAAQPADRAVSLSEGKRLGAFPEEGIARLAGLQCPFRGTLEFEVAAGDEN